MDDDGPKIVAVGGPPADVAQWMLDAPTRQKIALCCQLLQSVLLELGGLVDAGDSRVGESGRL